MPKFIIGYGLNANVDVIEATDLDAALTEAVGRSALDGVFEGDDACCDLTWAEPYTEGFAYDLGLLDPPTQRDVWRSQAPWR